MEGIKPRQKNFLKIIDKANFSKKPKSDTGISDAFNKGIKIASGDLIMFLHSGDVLIDPQYLNTVRERFISNQNICFVHSNMYS